MPKKKILFLITKATWGGAQRYVHDLATNLPKGKFEPVVAYGTQGKLAQDLSTAGIKVLQLPSLGRDIAIVSDIKSFFEIRKCIKDVQPDIVHLNSSKAAALGALAARIARVPKIIFTVHGWPFKESRNPLARLVIYKISWFTALLSHETIAVSRTDEALGKRMWGMREEKVRYIPLGFGPLCTLPPAEAYNAMFRSLKPAKLKNSTLRLVTIGELTANKGLRYAVDAVALLSERNIDTVYVVAGEGEERDALQERAKKAGVGDRVFFPGFVANAAQNLSGFDVFVLPSIKEGTPYVLLEAARAGLPIATTSVIDHDLAIRLPNARLVPIRDATALADAIVELSKLPRMQKKDDDIFALSEMIRKTAELYLSAGTGRLLR